MTTGLTCYFVAKAGLFVLFLSAVFHVVDYWWNLFPDVEAHVVTLFLGLIFVPFFIVPRLAEIQMNEERLYKGLPLYQINQTSADIFFRLLWTYLSCLDVFEIFVRRTSIGYLVLVHFLAFGFWLFHYFAAVILLPPGKSKVGKLVEKIKASFRKPTSVPVPSSNLTSRPAA